jgi:hypothetical protein
MWTHETEPHSFTVPFDVANSCNRILSKTRIIGALIGSVPFLENITKGEVLDGSNIDVYFALRDKLGF